MHETRSFGSWLKQARRRRDLTQEALAEQVGCATPTLSKIEQGTRRPSRELAELLLNALALPSDDRSAILRLARAAATADEPPPPFESAAEAPSLPSARSMGRARLPLPIAPLIGREAERAAVLELLASPTSRLLTLLGPGGIGKTRLALQIAADIAAAPARPSIFADGVVWVSLAALTAADQLPSAIAAALGIPVYGATPPDVQLLEALRERALLLVLDNFEHLPDAVGLLAVIVRAAPDVRLLVTSRERLRLQDEHVYTIAGLTLPGSHAHTNDWAIGDQRSPVATERAAAVLLFLERASRLDHSFVLSPRNRSDIARICQLLAGVPLAIELAAAWTRTLSCVEIAAAIAQNLDFLTLSDRDVAPRHQSLRAVFDHSWQLLLPPERAALASMSVFRGGCRADAVAAINHVMPATLAALSDASLLRRTQDADGGSRYDLHELVRQYAAERLTDDLRAEVEQRHMRFYANLLQAQMQALQSDGLITARATLEPDRDNVRDAWEHAVAHHELAVLRQMSRGMTTLCEDAGWLHAAAQIFGRAVTALRRVDPTPELSVCIGQLLSRYGYFVARSGRLAEADILLKEALQLLEASADPDRVHVLTHLCSMSYQLGRYDDARRYGRDAVAFAETYNNQFYKGLALCFLLMTALATHDDTAAPLLTEALAHWRANGSPRGLTLILCLQSSMRLAQGSAGEALALAREALRLSGPTRDRWLMAFVFMHLGMAALGQGDREEARYLCRESAEAARALADPWLHGQTLNSLGWSEHAAGDGRAAGQAFAQAARIGCGTPSPATALHALLGLATLAVDHGQRDAARTWLGAIVQHPATEYGVRIRAQALDATLTMSVAGISAAPHKPSAGERSLEALVDQAVVSVAATQER